MSDQPNLAARVTTLEEIARSTVEMLARIEDRLGRNEDRLTRLEASQTETRVAVMERIDRLEDKITVLADDVAAHTAATEMVRRTHSD